MVETGKQVPNYQNTFNKEHNDPNNRNTFYPTHCVESSASQNITRLVDMSHKMTRHFTHTYHYFASDTPNNQHIRSIQRQPEEEQHQILERLSSDNLNYKAEQPRGSDEIRVAEADTHALTTLKRLFVNIEPEFLIYSYFQSNCDPLLTAERILEMEDATSSAMVSESGSLSSSELMGNEKNS